jgi:phosphoenolpyruvate synthase/pyruvate phosphate dikinase
MANVTVFGRTHDPFTGEPSIFVHPDDNELAAKVRQVLTDSKKPIEIESDGTKIIERPLRQTISAAASLAVSAFEKGELTEKQVLMRIPQDQLLKLLQTQSADVSALKEIGTGLGVSLGVCSGNVATTSKEAVERANKGERIILVVDQTTPEDMAALELAVAIVNTTGGYTSHSAVIARQLGKPCIVSYTGTTPKGLITVDGSNGKIYAGEASYSEVKISDNTVKILAILDKVAKLHVYANADTSDHVKVGLENGARGIGLCRTEHTFFTEAGLLTIRKLILAKTDTEKTKAIEAFETAQKTHFVNVFTTLGNNPATIRLLDPPLHEFLPGVHDKEAIAELALAAKMKIGDVKTRIKELHESNPMLGNRGCRLSITFGRLAEVQTRAIVAAARKVATDAPGKAPTYIGIMVPLVTSLKEMQKLVDEIKTGIADGTGSTDIPEDFKKYGQKFEVGAMIETPRACLITRQLGEVCDFFSFGTNDLTQTMWALSRDDGGTFMPSYIQSGLVDNDPFETLDKDGVGIMMAHAVEALGDLRPKVKLGICGEHGGDRASIDFCHQLGLDYISCAPPRLLQARIAAAYAALGATNDNATPAETLLDPPIMVVAKEVKPKFDKGRQLKSIANFTPATFMTTEAMAKAAGKTAIACSNDAFIEYDAQDHVSDLTVGMLIGYNENNLLLQVKAGNLGSKMKLLEGTKLLDGLDIKTFDEDQLWFVRLEDVKYYKSLSKLVSYGGSINIPNMASKPVKGYEESKLEWVDLKNIADLDELNNWLVLTKDNQVGQIIGMSKVKTSQVIVNMTENGVAKVDVGLVVKVAPQGTPSPKKDVEYVKSEPTLDMTKLKEMTYKSLCENILGKYAKINNPDVSKTKVTCRIIGSYPYQTTVSAFVLLLPKDCSVAANKYINKSIEFIPDVKYVNKQLHSVMFDDILSVSEKE